MAFVSTTLCEMASDFKSVRSGPSLNTNWIYAYQLIENSQIEKAIIELSKVRQNWMHRSDLLIRASRHYEGAMLAFIRQAISSFKTKPSESNVIII
jgi:fucokinase